MAIAEIATNSGPSSALDDLFYEVVDGQFVELPPMGVRETVLATRLASRLEFLGHADQIGRIALETLFRLRSDGTLDRRPDLAFVSFERWPSSRALPTGGIWEVVPDLAVEVVSPSNSANEVVRKVRDYFEAGSRSVWVVFPVDHIFYIYEDIDNVRILRPEKEVDGAPVLPDFRLKIADLFKGVD